MEFVKRKADEIAKSINLRKKPFTVVRLPLDIGVSLRYIKCINNVNTLLTYLVQYMLRFPEVFEDLAELAAE